jgi:hypothetical protein
MTMLKRFLFRHQGQVSAALVLGGVDATGPHLYTIYPHGSTDKLPYVTMGSGSLAAMSVFETGFKDNLTEDEAKALVCKAIRAGIFNDLGSGSNVDICIIRKGSYENPDVEMHRGYEKPNEQSELRGNIARPTQLDFPRGCTDVASTSFAPLRNRVDIIGISVDEGESKAGGATDMDLYKCAVVEGRRGGGQGGVRGGGGDERDGGGGAEGVTSTEEENDKHICCVR